MNKKFLYTLMAFTFCLGVGTIGTGCFKEEEEEQPTVKYQGDMLYNGFDSVSDLYRIDQLYTWGFQPADGKLEIVGKDNFMPKAEEENPEAKTDYQSVIAKIDALPALADVTFAHKDTVAKARQAFGCLSNENRQKVTNLSKLEALENSDALKGYYTVGDFGGGFSNDLSGVARWSGHSGDLVNATKGTVIFEASNIMEADGSFYVALFHDGSINLGQSGDGIYMMLRTTEDLNRISFSNSTGADISFHEGQGISSTETYTFEISYEVAQDYSKLTISIIIRDSAGVEILNGSQDITSFNLSNFGEQTVKSWLCDHENAASHNTFYINAGASEGAKIINAWTPTVAKDYDATLNEDPHKEADLAPRQGNGALRVYYEGGKFTELFAKFEDSLLTGMPVEEIGSFSVKVYNDSVEEKQVTLSLMKENNEVLTVDGGEFTLAPYAWTECKVALEPVITKQFQEQLIGFNVRFEDVEESVYYLDDFRVQFGPVYTAETNKWMAKADELETQIKTLVGKTITADDKALLESLCLKYDELPQTFRYIVENASVLEEAVSAYMSAVSKQQLAAESKETVLYFDSPISAMQIGEVTGATVTYTTEDKAPGETGGSMKISYDGSMAWSRVELAPYKKTGYEEIHVWVNNKSDSERVFLFDWVHVSQAFDADGNEIVLKMDKPVSQGGGQCVLPANSGWIKLVFREWFPLTQINTTSLSLGGTAMNSVDTLLIGKIDFVYKFGAVSELIAALPEYYEGYSAEDIAAVQAARSAYDQLSIESQLNLTNASKLIDIEAKIWKSGFSANDLTTPDALTVYSAELKAKIDALREAYNALNEDVRKTLIEEEKLLCAFEEKIEQLQVDYVEIVKTQISALDGTDKAAVEAARAAYESLTNANKALVDNVGILYGFEADIWAATIAELPTEEEIIDYDLSLLDKFAAIHAEYDALADEVKALVADELATLAALEARHARFGEVVLRPGEIKATASEWHKVEITSPITSGYDEARVLLRNDSEHKTVFQATWNIADKAYDENGDEIELVGGYVLPANSGWITLVFKANFEWSELNMVLFDEANQAMAGEINLTIASVTFVYKAPVVEGMIEALDGTDAAAVEAARAAYEALCAESKANVANLDKLVGYEADLWKVGMAGLPTSVEEVTAYDAAMDGKVDAMLASYAQLNAEIQAKLTAEKELLDGLKAKLELLQAELVDAVKAQINALTETSTAEEVAVVREAYDLLSAENQAQVDNANILFGYEAGIWTATLVELPTVDEIVAYDAELAAKLSAVREAYEALADEVKALVADEEATLSALEAKLAQLEEAEEPVEDYKEVVLETKNIVDSGSAWYTVAITPTKTSGYLEAHVKLRNNGASAIVFQVNWNAAVKAYDADGNEIAADANGVIEANSGWITLVFTQTNIAWTEFNIAHYENAAVVGDIDVTVESVTFVYESPSEVVLETKNIVDSGSAWYTVAITPTKTSGYLEAQVKLRNNGASAIVFQVNWNVAVKAYDADGNEIAADANGVIEANSGWITLVFTQTNIAWTEFNIAHYENAAVVGDIDVTVESVTFVYEKTVYDFSNNISEVSSVTVANSPTENVTATYSESEKALEIGFNGLAAATWVNVALNTETVSEFTTLHLYVKNDTNADVALQMNWNAYTKVEDGDASKVTTIWNGTTCIKANSGWLEIVYTVEAADIQNLNIALVSEVTSGALYVSKITIM